MFDHWYDWPFICGHREVGLAWVRVCGFGIHGKDTGKFPLLFGERNGMSFGIRIGRFYFGLLKP